MTLDDISSLKPKKISCVDTQLGYMQLLEYTLQDFSYLHVLQWHFANTTGLTSSEELPKQNTKTFYQNKTAALQEAYEIGKNLLKQHF